MSTINLSNKKLLMMGGTAYFDHIKKYAIEKGFAIIAVGNNPKARYYSEADEAYPYSTMDVENIIKLVNDRKIDGIFVGAQELNMLPAIEVAEKTGVNFYAERECWNILSDKAQFKKKCIEYNIPVVPEYEVKNAYDTDSLIYPVLLKPVDGSGAHGMNVCYCADDFARFYEEALRWSVKKQVIVEKYIEKADETFFQFTIQDGVCSLTSAFTKVFTHSNDGNLILPIFHMYPSKHIDDYYEKLHDNMCRFFEGMHVKNGVMTVQCFYQDGDFYIFEAGYRMGGAQNYIFSDYQNGTNSLEYMVNFALTGKMDNTSIAESDNARFKYPCCNYYVGLKPGKIKTLPTKNDVEQLEGVLNVTVMRSEGDIIEDTNSLDRICLRIHVVGKDNDDLAKNLVKISSSLKIISENGEEMQLEHLTYDRCIDAINSCVLTK